MALAATIIYPHGDTVREHSGRQQPQRQVEVPEEDLGQEEAGDRAEEGQQEAEREACQEASAEQVPAEGGQRQGAGEDEANE